MDKRTLLKPRLAEATVEVPGVGTVRVRELTRAEVVDEMPTVDRSVPGAFEAWLVATALVDPKLTEAEVLQWRTQSQPWEIEAVITAINELSALTKGAAKDAWKELEASPDAEFRDVPGEGAVDDGGAAEG